MIYSFFEFLAASILEIATGRLYEDMINIILYTEYALSYKLFPISNNVGKRNSVYHTNDPDNDSGNGKNAALNQKIILTAAL